MSTRKVICQYCRKQFSRQEELFEKVAKGYYHKVCYDKMLEERSLRTGIFDYLETLTPEKVNYPLVQKQIREYTEKYGYTESGLLGTLHYMVEVKRMKLSHKTGIAFLPYLYHEAREYYSRLSLLSDIEVVTHEERTVVVTPKESKRLSNLIDIESLLMEDDDN